jgi:hypothetical protein
MSQFNVVKNSTNPDQVYFDVTVTNFESTTTFPPVFYYNESRTMPFIENPEDYFLSIVRFTVETTTLPTQIVSIEPNQADINKTIYSVTLEYPGFAPQQVFIDWIPQDNLAPIPPPPSETANGLQYDGGGYYNAYSNTWFINLVNTALAQAFTNLNALFPPPPTTTTYAPFLQWDNSTQSAVLLADVEYYDVNQTSPPSPNPSPIKIYMNAPLFTFFNSFPSILNGYIGITDGKNFQLQIANNNYSNLQTITLTAPGVTPVVQYRAMSLYQEVSTIPNWTPITSLVFTSGTLPVVPNQVSTPLIFNNSQQIALGGNNSAVSNIITDLVVQSGDYRSNVVYLPEAQYRLITLRGNTPLKQIDLEIFYRVKTGQLIPFRLGSGQTVTMKLAFLKKESIQLANHLNPLLPTTSIPTSPPNTNNSLAPSYQGDGIVGSGRRR